MSWDEWDDFDLGPIGAGLDALQDVPATHVPASVAEPARVQPYWGSDAHERWRAEPAYARGMQQARERLERQLRRRQRGRSNLRPDTSVSLREWMGGERPSYARVADAVERLCLQAPRQWAGAIHRIAGMPRGTVAEVNRWDGAWDALDRLAAFDEQHGQALRWVLTDEDVRQKAEQQAQRVARTVDAIYARHDVNAERAADARERLAECERFEAATRGKSAWQVCHETGRSLKLWTAQAAMSDEQKLAAQALLQRWQAALDQAVEFVSRYCEAQSCKPPKLRRQPRQDQVLGAINRARCARWWRRALRNAAARIVEAGAIKLGMVNRRTGGYCSNHALAMRQAQQRRNATTLNATLMRNEAGQIYTLAELAAGSVSNPVIRGGELMTRIRGCEEFADEQGHIGLFITLTTPSAMHPMLSREWRDRSAEGVAATALDAAQHAAAQVFRAIKNPRYDGKSTPRDAQDWLCRQWSRARTALGKRGVKYYGMRVAEPHHDGTPHWHMLLWVKSARDAQVLQEVIYDKWVNNDRRYVNERGAAKNRTNFKRLQAGGAAGYIAKYIAKSIGHHALKEHLDESETGDLLTVEMGGQPGYLRVDAWASTWGIRQFQPQGQPSVTVWRELRRVTPDQVQALPWHTEAQTRLAFDAVHKVGDKQADWAAYMRAQGGVCLKRSEYRLRAACRTTEKLNRYGEVCHAKKVVGVRTPTGKWLISRRMMWTALDERETQEAREAMRRVKAGMTPQDEAERAAKAAPWTGFNNCTARMTQGRANWMWADDERRAEVEANAQKWGVVARYLTHRRRQELEFFGADSQTVNQAAPLHACMGREEAVELLRVMRMSVADALRGMERDGWTRNGIVTQ